MACVAEIYSSAAPLSEYPRKRRKLTSSWDVLPSQLQELFDQNHKKRRKMSSSWDVLPCGLKVQTVLGIFEPISVFEQVSDASFEVEDRLLLAEVKELSCSTESRDNHSHSRYVSPPIRADDKDGHYRFEIGENLTSRYRILSKMGEGTFGQVLECLDRLYSDHVAIKIVRGQEKYREEAMIEIEMIQKVSMHDKSGSRCVQMRDWFDYRNHICIVFEKLGSSLYDCLKKNDYRPFPIDVVRDVGRQLLESVAYMHELNLVHTDLKPENILFVSSEIMKVPEAKGLKESKDFIELPKSNKIKLIDFGSTELEERYRTSVIQTRHYRAPEVILGLGWDRACDVWSVGCILVELCSGDTLFQTHENLEHLAMMERVLGPFPYHMVRRSEKRKYFSHGNRLYWPEGASSKESINRVRKLPKLRELVAPHVKHYGQFLDLLHGLICFDPSDRMTATEALRHPFFKDGYGK